ncbi:hypothetical protein Hanom_Chr12g01068251 [Helianthus anomalus]
MERVLFELIFGPRWVSARRMFWIGTGRFESRFGPTRVSARDGFWIATGFGPTRFSHGTSLGSGRDGFRFVLISVFILTKGSKQVDMYLLLDGQFDVNSTLNQKCFKHLKHK